MQDPITTGPQTRSIPSPYDPDMGSITNGRDKDGVWRITGYFGERDGSYFAWNGDGVLIGEFDNEYDAIGAACSGSA
jgi:hypothetical protein